MDRERVSFLTVSQQFNLNTVCSSVTKLFGYGIYQVGSSLKRQDFRDVDLRCILSNEEFDRMFAIQNGDKILKFFNVSISEWLQSRTGLPIDFQFQREQQANEEFNGPRNAVGIGV